MRIAALSVLALIGCVTKIQMKQRAYNQRDRHLLRSCIKNYIALSKGDYDAGNYRNSTAGRRLRQPPLGQRRSRHRSATGAYRQQVRK